MTGIEITLQLHFCFNVGLISSCPAAVLRNSGDGWTEGELALIAPQLHWVVRLMVPSVVNCCWHGGTHSILKGCNLHLSFKKKYFGEPTRLIRSRWSLLLQSFVIRVLCSCCCFIFCTSAGALLVLNYINECVVHQSLFKTSLYFLT